MSQNGEVEEQGTEKREKGEQLQEERGEKEAQSQEEQGERETHTRTHTHRSTHAGVNLAEKRKGNKLETQ